jgi:hypothetical protein
MTMTRSLLGRSLFCGFLTVSAVSRTALADDVSGAANAFSRAQKAELSGDYASAAELYELADGLAPAPEALRSALRARKAAGELEVAAVHAEELLARYSNDPKSTELAKATLDEAAKKLMRYEIACRPSACTLLVDGAAASADSKENHLVYLAPGTHEIRASFGKNQTDPQSAEGAAGYRGSLGFDAPPEPAAPLRADIGSGVLSGGVADSGTSSHGISPWFFASGAIATVGLGAATIWSGLDVLSAHDSYVKNQTTAGYNDGRSRELRTNVLIGATSVVGAATCVLAIFTNWGGKHGEAAAQPAVQATAAVSGNAASIVVSGTY